MVHYQQFIEPPKQLVIPPHFHDLGTEINNTNKSAHFSAVFCVLLQDLFKLFISFN